MTNHELVKVEPGKTFGRWLVLEAGARNDAYQMRWKCRCQCGAEVNGLGAVIATRHQSGLLGLQRAKSSTWRMWDIYIHFVAGHAAAL